MTTYLITILLVNRRIHARVRAEKPSIAICSLIQQIGRPAAVVMGLTCKRMKT